MAYKFQLGSAVMSGALAQEGTFEVKDDEGSLRYSVNRDTGLVSGSGMLIVNDNAYFKGARTEVSGALTAQGNSVFFLDLDVKGALSGGAELLIQDRAQLKSTLNVSGAVTAASSISAASLSASGDLNIADNATINGTARIYGAITADTGLNGPVGAATQAAGKFTSLSASLDLLVQARTQLKSTLNVSGAATFASRALVTGELTASSNVLVGGNATFSGSTIKFFGLSDDTNFAQATDSLFYYDLTTKQMKRQTNAQYLTAIKGVGLTVADGKLNVEEAGTTVIRWGDAAVTLQEGFNVGTASLSTARTWTLPSGSAVNDRVHVKRADGVGILTIAKGAALETIDGQASILLESPSGSVSLVYIDINRWSVY